MFVLRLTLVALLAGGLVGCSRSQKFGARISAQDIAQAMPEFTLVMPPGATNVYFERNPRRPFTRVYLRLTSVSSICAAQGYADVSRYGAASLASSMPA